MTDVELSRQINDVIAKDYLEAVEFIEVNPRHSLVIFRDILSYLCDEIATFNNLNLLGNTLEKKIKQLFFDQIIDLNFNNILNNARQLGNTGAHKIYIGRELEDEKEFCRIYKETQLESARNARNLIVDAFINTLNCLNKKVLTTNIDYVVIAEQEYKQIFYDAIIYPSNKAKLKAGVLYESMAENEFQKNILYTTEEQLLHIQNLYQNAASCYQAAFKMSAEVDRKIKHPSNSRSIDEIILQDCDLEPLYRYSKILCQKKDGSNQEELGLKYLKIASDRKHPDATAYYAAYLYEVLKDYNQAFEYMNKTYVQEVPLVHRLFCHYYSNKEVDSVNYELALQHINKAIDLNCSDALFVLGEAYHIGSFVEKNDTLAETFLKRAIEKGNLQARKYYLFTFQKGTQKIAKEISSFFKELSKQISVDNKNSNIPKIERNSICTCGSGKKYKKCCGQSN